MNAWIVKWFLKTAIWYLSFVVFINEIIFFLVFASVSRERCKVVSNNNWWWIWCVCVEWFVSRIWSASSIENQVQDQNQLCNAIKGNIYRFFTPCNFCFWIISSFFIVSSFFSLSPPFPIWHSQTSALFLWIEKFMRNNWIWIG